MDGKNSNNKVISSKRGDTTTTTWSDVNQSNQRPIQNFALLWLDANIDSSTKAYENVLIQLQSVVNDVHTFTERDECVDFLTDIVDQKAFLIIEGGLGKKVLHIMHDIPQLHSVYILCRNKSKYEDWAKTWVKVKGIHTEITPICESAQYVVKRFQQDHIAISFIAPIKEASSDNLNQLDPTFMYTQIFKEILLGMDYNKQSTTNFAAYCRKGDYGTASNINRFENEYRAELAIWWYTSSSFVYSLLNFALRTMEADTIIHMGFLIHDLHRQIDQLHQKQVDGYDGKLFTVYRGQGLSTVDYEKLRKTKGGLMSFNNFLSTSGDREISLAFAMSASEVTETVGILFRMSIDPCISSTPFAAIQEVSQFATEEEILFSMHSIFRIGEIKPLDNDNPLYQVDLQLTSDDDPQLRTLTERIRVETSGDTGWERLGQLLLKIGQFNKAEELYKTLFEQTSVEIEKAHYYHQLGYVKHFQGTQDQAIRYYEKALEMRQKTLSPNHPSLATSYNNMGGVYDNMGEYSKALSFYEKALEMRQKTLPPNHPSLATSYNNIASVYDNMGEYLRALSFYEKALEISQKTLPPNHPSLATSYNNIASVYDNMGEYSKALSFYEKALEIMKKTLPPNHPLLATSYNNIGSVYSKMGEYSKALSFYEKALEMRQKTLPPNHPSLATSYNSIGGMYDNMGEYSKALSFYERALEMRQKTLPPNHPSLATSYNNMGGVYDNMEEYSKALSFYEKAFQIMKKTLPPNHPLLATSYNNIASVYDNMGEYSKALSFYERALEIRQKTLPPNHPSLATSYSNIASVYSKMGEHSKALPFHEKALEMQQKILPPNHPLLAISYNNIGSGYRNMREYSKALSYLERALDILQRSLPPNHPNIQTVRQNIEIVKKKL